VLTSSCYDFAERISAVSEVFAQPLFSLSHSFAVRP
jgi:hypothetical protein